MSRPAVLFYCQHSLGLGHLVRSLALVEGLAASFDVVLMNGGRLPDGIQVPPGVDLVNLPPIGQVSHDLISYDPALTVDEALHVRREMLVDALGAHEPVAVVIELFPFGRKKFAPEIVPFLEAVHALGAGRRPVVVTSVRDLLVGDRPDQLDHDDRACALCNRWFDGVLVHADPRFARLEETFRPRIPLEIPVHYTGFVAPGGGAAVTADRRRERVLVSAGGGMAGEQLMRAAVAAAPLIRQRSGLETTIVAGPFAPDPLWRWVERAARELSGVTAVRQVPDLAAEIACSAISVSQCGYNTSMDLIRAAVPAVVVPYAERRDTEQTDRARRLSAAGVVSVLPPGALTGPALAAAVAGELARARPAGIALDLDGAAASATLIGSIVAAGPRPAMTAGSGT